MSVGQKRPSTLSHGLRRDFRFHICTESTKELHYIGNNFIFLHHLGQEDKLRRRAQLTTNVTSKTNVSMEPSKAMASIVLARRATIMVPNAVPATLPTLFVTAGAMIMPNPMIQIAE